MIEHILFLAFVLCIELACILYTAWYFERTLFKKKREK